MPAPDPPTRPTPAPRRSRGRILAAVERAERHRTAARERPAAPAGVAASAILEHLGLAARSAAARDVRGLLGELADEGSLARARRHGVEVWALTRSGRRRLRAARDVRLGESPQHRAWRDARAAAGRQLPHLRAQLGRQLDLARLMLAAEEAPPHSDAWFELAARLRAGAWRVGSAWHCLREWPEPDDARADVDARVEPGDPAQGPAARARLRSLRAGRRNPRLWGERA
jgi:hypothetical protein